MGFWDAVASGGPYANSLHLGPDKKNTAAPHHWIFIGRTLFLVPNQQCQSTEGMNARVNESTKHHYPYSQKHNLNL